MAKQSKFTANKDKLSIGAKFLKDKENGQKDKNYETSNYLLCIFNPLVHGRFSRLGYLKIF